MATREWYRNRIAELEEKDESREDELFSLRGEKWKLQKKIFSMERANRSRYALYERDRVRVLGLLSRVLESRVNKELKNDINEYIREHASEEAGNGSEESR